MLFGRSARLALPCTSGCVDLRFAGLDYTLYLAKMYDIKVLLVLIDNWSSVPQYLDWSPTVASLDALDTHIPKDPGVQRTGFAPALAWGAWQGPSRRCRYHRGWLREARGKACRELLRVMTGGALTSKLCSPATCARS